MVERLHPIKIVGGGENINSFYFGSMWTPGLFTPQSIFLP